ncbi:MAG: hypothetical protein ACTJLK_03245, partial [Anaplasma sp.]
TGSGTANDPTNKTNCRSGAPAPKGSAELAGLGIGSEDVKSTSGTDNTKAKALTKDMYDTLVKAFEANDASTAGEASATDTCKDASGSGEKEACGSAVKAGNAFDGASWLCAWSSFSCHLFIAYGGNYIYYVSVFRTAHVWLLLMTIMPGCVADGFSPECTPWGSQASCRY